MYLKNWDTFDPQSLKKTRLIFCDTEWPYGHCITWKMGNTGLLNGLLIMILFYKLTSSIETREMGTSAICVALCLSQDMPALCPKGADLGVKPSGPVYSLTLPLYLGLPTE